MAVHGGAGALPRGSLTPEQEKAFREGLEKALRAGAGLLADGRSSLDAVEAAVRVLEDDPPSTLARAPSSTPTASTSSTPRS